MADGFPTQRFDSTAALVAFLKSRADDIDGMKIMVVNDLAVSGPQGGRILKNCCGLIQTVNGEQIVLHRDDLAALLNDGILQRLRLPVELVPQIAR